MYYSFLRIVKFLCNYELGNPKYILMFAGIGSGALVVISLVIVACVKKSRSTSLQGEYISLHPCVEYLYHKYKERCKCIREPNNQIIQIMTIPIWKMMNKSHVILVLQK